MAGGLARIRNPRKAQRAAYAGGAILILTGSTGAVTLVRLGWIFVHRVLPRIAELLEPLLILLFVMATLGGVTVVVGAYFLPKRRGVGRFLIAFGAGAGVALFLVKIILLALSGANPARFLISLALSLEGIGVLLAVYAQLRG